MMAKLDWFTSMLSKLGIAVKFPFVIYCDNVDATHFDRFKMSFTFPILNSLPMYSPRLSYQLRLWLFEIEDFHEFEGACQSGQCKRMTTSDES